MMSLRHLFDVTNFVSEVLQMFYMAVVFDSFITLLYLLLTWGESENHISHYLGKSRNLRPGGRRFLWDHFFTYPQEALIF